MRAYLINNTEVIAAEDQESAETFHRDEYAADIEEVEDITDQRNRVVKSDDDESSTTLGGLLDAVTEAPAYLCEYDN